MIGNHAAEALLNMAAIKYLQEKWTDEVVLMKGADIAAQLIKEVKESLEWDKTRDEATTLN